MEKIKNNKVLIVVDAQNDFVTGSLANWEARRAVPIIAKQIKACVSDGWNVVLTKDEHHIPTYRHSQEGRKLPIEHCIIQTEGWKFVNAIYEVLPRELPFTKKIRIVHKSTFGYDGWRKLFNSIPEFSLDGPKQIYICGFCTDICVITNAILLKTYYPESEIFVLADCCAGTTPEKHRMALEVMKSCQIEVIFDELEVQK